MSSSTREYYGDSERKDVHTNRPGLHNSSWWNEDPPKPTCLHKSSWWNDGPTNASQQHTSRFRSELYGEPKDDYCSWCHNRETASALQHHRMHWEQEHRHWERKEAERTKQAEEFRVQLHQQNAVLKKHEFDLDKAERRERERECERERLQRLRELDLVKRELDLERLKRLSRKRRFS
jgi:hypothetical protein